MVKPGDIEGQAAPPVGAMGGFEQDPGEAGDSTDASRDTEAVLAAIFVERYEREHDGQHIPCDLGATNTSRKIHAIGTKLANIGDAIEKEHGKTIDEQVTEFFKSGEGSFERFSDVASHILTNNFNWGRVMTVIFFGYRVAVHQITDNASEFIKKIFKMLVKFFFTTGLTRWIVEHGGWERAVRALSENGNWTMMFSAVIVVAAIGLVASFLLQRGSR